MQLEHQAGKARISGAERAFVATQLERAFDRQLDLDHRALGRVRSLEQALYVTVAGFDIKSIGLPR